MALVEWLFGHLFWNAVAGDVPADPSKIRVDRENDESVLFAAAMFDHHGLWDEAIELYEYARQRWPEQHARYADNCIADVRRKIGLCSTAANWTCENCGEALFEAAAACPMCGATASVEST